MPFPSLKIRAFMLFWRLVWIIALPLFLAYLWHRGRKDPLYKQHLGERFGFHKAGNTPHVWVHAVSMGEMRSAEPLIRELLARGESVVTTHFTPAGRHEAKRAFGPEIASGQLRAVWVPFDDPRAFRRFFRAFQPKYGLVMEVELWPGMIMACRSHAVPLFQCNGQYPTRSYERDQTKWLSRIDIIPGLAGAMVKNDVQAERLRQAGLNNVAVTGELRFDQSIPPAQVSAAQAARSKLFQDRKVIAFVSVVEGEDPLYLSALKELQGEAAFVYVPRAPERFGDTAAMLTAEGLRSARRSEVLNSNLIASPEFPELDVLLGDSLGEMYFYLSLADFVVVGGGFSPKGSHNIIEPLSLGKPVIVGPQIWTIEFPGKEALAAGVCRQAGEANLTELLRAPIPQADIAGFVSKHGGSVTKILDALPALLKETKK